MPFKLDVPPGLDKVPSVGSVFVGGRVVWLCQQSPAAAKPSEVIVADLEGRVVNRFELGGRPSLYVEPFGREFSPAAVAGNAGYLAVTLDNGQAVAVYDLNSGKRLLNEKFEKTDQPAVYFAQDPKTLFVKQNGKPIRRFELPSGKEQPPLEGTGRDTQRVAASPDGKWVAAIKSVSSKMVDGKPQTVYPKVLEVYDGEQGKRVGEMEVGSMVYQFLFADNDNVLVCIMAARPPLQVNVTFAKWNAATRKKTWEVLATGHSLAVSPDGKRFVAGGPSQFFLHDAADGKLLVDAGGHSSFVDWVAFSPDGKTVTTAGGGEVMTWELDGRRKVRVSVPELRNASPSLRVATTNHLTWVAYTDGDTPKLALCGWDHEKGAVGWKIPVEQSAGWVATPDGQHLVSVRGDAAKSRNVVTVHEIPSGKSLREWSYLPPKGSRILGSALFSGPQALCGDGRFVVTAEDGAIKMMDALTGEEVATVKHAFDKPPAGPEWIPTFGASADGARLAVVEKGKISVYQPKSGKLLARQAFPDGTPRRLKFSPDGRQLAMWQVVGSPDSSCVLIWDVDSPQVLPRKLVAEPWSTVYCAAFSPDGKKLAVGYVDGTALIWDLTAK